MSEGLLGELKARIGLDLSELHKGAVEAKAELKSVGDEGSGHLNKFAGAAKVASLAIGAAAIGFAAESVKAAMEGEKAHAALVNAVKRTGASMSDINPIVEEQTKKFEKLGYQNDELEMGLAKLTQMTGNAKLALNDIGIAADLAAAKHISLEAAAGLVGKVAVGNLKPLKQLGIETKNAAGETISASEAMKLLTDRYGGNAQAQAETFAGKTKALKAEFENLSEKVGNVLIPVLEEVFGDLADGVNFLEKNHAAAIALGVAIGGPLVAALGSFIVTSGIAFGSTLLGGIAAAADAVTGLGAALAGVDLAEAGLAASMGSLVLGIGAVVAPLAILTFGITSYFNEQKKAKAEVKAYTDALREDTGAIGDNTRALMIKHFQDKDQLDDLNRAGVSHRQLTAALSAHTSKVHEASMETIRYEETQKGQSGVQKELIDKLGDSKNAYDQLLVRLARHNELNIPLLRNLEDQKDKFGDASVKAKDYAKFMGDAGKANDDTGQAIDKGTKKVVDQRTAYEKLSDAIDKYGKQLHDAINPTLAAQDAQADYNASLDTLHEALKGSKKELFDHAGNINLNTEAGRKLQAAFSDSAQKAGTLTDALAKDTQISSDNRTQRQNQIDQLERMKQLNPEVAGSVQPLIDKLKEVSTVPTVAQLQLDTSQAWKALADFQKDSGGALTAIVSGQGHGRIPVRAAGGPVMPYATYRVNEKGDEFLTMGSRGGFITPANQTTNNLGGVTVVVNGSGMTPDEAMAAVASKLMPMLKAGVGAR